MMKNLQKGFTIVEMAIITVIIGFIITAIVAGQEYLGAAERQAVIKDLNGYSSAISTFVIQYNKLPGDMMDASSYWTGASNGNGDGNIAGHTTESAYVWNHLMRAEIIKGRYTGSYSAAAINTSVPAAKGIKTAFYKIHAAGQGSDNWGIGANPIYERTGNFLALGSIEGTDYGGGAISSQTAKAIDDKIDDGKASAGSIVVTRGTLNGGTSWQTGCTDAAETNATAFTTKAANATQYSLSSKNAVCRLYYWLVEAQ